MSRPQRVRVPRRRRTRHSTRRRSLAGCRQAVVWEKIAKMKMILHPRIWRYVEPRLVAARAVLVALDFDGVLAPIVEQPETAAASPSTLALVETLALKPGYGIAVISGRALDDARQRVGIYGRGVSYCGNHGLEMELEGHRWRAPGAEEAARALEEAWDVLSRAVRSLPGVMLENKSLSISVHYRNALPAVKQSCLRLSLMALGTLIAKGEVKAIKGKEVLEIQLALPWDKGKCLSYLANLGMGNDGQPLCVFLGDDVFDEPAFQAARSLGGLAIFVGERRSNSAAEFYLPAPGDVETFLQRLVNLQSTDLAHTTGLPSEGIHKA